MPGLHLVLKLAKKKTKRKVPTRNEKAELYWWTFKERKNQSLQTGEEGKAGSAHSSGPLPSLICACASIKAASDANLRWQLKHTAGLHSVFNFF